MRKKDHEVHENSPEKLPEKSPVTFTPEGSPVKEKETEKVVSDIIEKMEIGEDKEEEKGVKVVEENGKVESDGIQNMQARFRGPTGRSSGLPHRSGSTFHLQLLTLSTFSVSGPLMAVAVEHLLPT